MYKRKSGDRLTGGTGDVNPQFMQLTIAEGAADAYAQGTFPVPIQRIQMGGNRAQVMEVLKVWFQSTDTVPSQAGLTASAINLQLTTKSQSATVNISEPSCFALQQKSQVSAFTAGGTVVANMTVDPFQIDLTDGQGHGVLIATDNIYFAIDSDNTGAVQTAYAKILYRWKDVSQTEYVGIVQSQT